MSVLPPVPARGNDTYLFDDFTIPRGKVLPAVAEE